MVLCHGSLSGLIHAGWQRNSSETRHSTSETAAGAGETVSKEPKEKLGATLSHKALPSYIFQVLCITLLTSAVLTQPQGGWTPTIHDYQN